MTKRVLYGFLLFGTACCCILGGGLFVAIAMCVACCMAGSEFVSMAKAKGYKPSPRIVRGMIIAFYSMAAVPSIMPWLHLSWNFPLEHFPMLMVIGVCISFFRLLFRREEHPPATIADMATTILGFIYIGFLPSHLVLLRNLAPPNAVPYDNPLMQPGLAYVWTALFCVWATDVYAYVCGRRFGRHLLYPQVSPKKTVEGAVGGFLGAVVWA
ncbi:MAG: phosphatidate cytidylyltransferase, partial [Terriglobales bacterium]